jgi:hypothetical protein
MQRYHCNLPAATCASTPAMIAPNPLPHDAMLNVLANQLSSNPRLRCSDTIQDSNDVNNSDVDMPPRIRPNSSAFMLGTCSIKLMTISNKQNTMHPSRRPYVSTYIPRKVPNTALDRKPVKNRELTFTPYDCGQETEATVPVSTN